MRATLLILLLSLVIVTEGVSFKPSHPLVYRTEWNWFNDSTGSIQSTNPGSYIKFSVKNTHSVSIGLSLPLIKDPFCTIAWSIDFGPMQSVVLPESGETVQLETNLDRETVHSVYFFIKNIRQGLNRWYGPEEYVRITGIQLDDGGSFVMTELQPKRLLVYWDSIGEGIQVLGSGHFTMCDSHVTWAFALADVIEAEISLVAWGGQGYTVIGSGKVPPLFNSSGVSAFQWLNSEVPRDFSICPEYIVNGHGTNDGLRGIPPAQVAPSVLGWMKAMRNNCKQSKIFVIVPFGGYEKEAIQQAYKTYMSATNDKRLKLIQLGANAAKGLDRVVPSGTFVAVDGIHPIAWRSAALAGHIVKGIAPFL
eukprot:TRINITY_DN4088_c0_g1_i1.p1 TRINITY_DN4088_c0_g1~~TRINITY_DN4088_c0_g1_i1.p1  ORF type:complete len:364 (+),score=99.52 TRINITY_DN4088_c0_g1_i1:126-1217(+)